jgi:hypothetical protein
MRERLGNVNKRRGGQPAAKRHFLKTRSKPSLFLFSFFGWWVMMVLRMGEAAASFFFVFK